MLQLLVLQVPSLQAALRRVTNKIWDASGADCLQDNVWDDAHIVAATEQVRLAPCAILLL